MGRLQGRITKEDVREAGLRRWDGQNRVTTDWYNLFHEPELSFPDGDCIVYLRESGQSSRGPTLRIHTARLRARAFNSLLQRCTPQTTLHIASQCVMSNCDGCKNHTPCWELYLPAAPRSGIDATFDHHITTRNFFAWLYGQPLAGRSLGKSLVDLKMRMDTYRPDDQEQNRADIITYAESQQYLDFRECVDHALAALRLAEALRLDDLWIDAFAHCVGLSHRGLRNSVEYSYLSTESKTLINHARVAMDNKLQRVSQAVSNFFEDELSRGFPGLPQVARDHIDRFRSFLHSFYIEQHGFWPPNNFDQEVIQRLICSSMYKDFHALYHHLADGNSPTGSVEPNINAAGGVCTLQNIRAFDARQGLMPLPHATPKIPSMAANQSTLTRSQRRNSWNPRVRQREERDRRNAGRMQALVDSTNRDWKLMSCVLVRRFSEFEVETAIDEWESISLADGRKVRWIAVYAILQSLISVTQAPKQVRNTEGLSYPLCCEAPTRMPWHTGNASKTKRTGLTDTTIQPDTQHSHTNTNPPSPVSLNRTLSRASTVSKSEPLKRSKSKASTVLDRRQTTPKETPGRSMSMKSSSTRSSSLRRLVAYKSTESLPEEVLGRPRPANRTSFCEIYVPGYGNGLNEVELQQKTEAVKEGKAAPKPPVNTTMSRESSNASSNSSWSQVSSQDESDISTPDASPVVLPESISKFNLPIANDGAPVHVVETDTNGLETVHFNSSTWDDMLNVLEKRRFNIMT